MFWRSLLSSTSLACSELGLTWLNEELMVDVGEEITGASGYATGPPVLCKWFSGVVDMLGAPCPLGGRPLDPVGLQTLRSRTKIGLSAFLPSAIMARPLNSLPLRCSANFSVSAHRKVRGCTCEFGDDERIALEKVNSRTKSCLEILTTLHSHPPSRALLENLHMVHFADLSNIIFDLLPRDVEWELRSADQYGLESYGFLWWDRSFDVSGLTDTGDGNIIYPRLRTWWHHILWHIVVRGCHRLCLGKLQN